VTTLGDGGELTKSRLEFIELELIKISFKKMLQGEIRLNVGIPGVVASLLVLGRP
jgi:hypothetical protein